MRALLLIGAVVGVGLIAPGAAPAVDKSQSTLAQPGFFAATSPPALTGPKSATWVNGTAKGKSKFTGCKVQVQLKGMMNLPDTDGIPGTGDEVICISDQNASIGLLSTAIPAGGIFRGEVSGNSVKIKADLAAEMVGCGIAGGNIVEYDSRMTCYEPSPAYNAAHGCGSADCTPAPFMSDPTQCVCTAGYPTRPTTNLIATEGLFYP
jgi:hypothetical protein